MRVWGPGVTCSPGSMPGFFWPPGSGTGPPSVVAVVHVASSRWGGWVGAKGGVFPLVPCVWSFCGHARACVRARARACFPCVLSGPRNIGWFEHYQIVHAYFIVADTFFSTAAVFIFLFNFRLSLSSHRQCRLGARVTSGDFEGPITGLSSSSSSLN